MQGVSRTSMWDKPWHGAAWAGGGGENVTESRSGCDLQNDGFASMVPLELWQRVMHNAVSN